MKYRSAIIKETFQRFQEVNAHDLGAALAYFAIFALIPLITLLILITGFILGGHGIQPQILDVFQQTLGSDAAIFLGSSLERGTASATTIPESIVGTIVLIFAVVTLTAQLQNSLERIFGGEKRKLHFFDLMKKKIASFSIVIFLAVFLLFFFTLSTGISVFEDILVSFLPFSYFYIPLIDLILSFLLIFGFALIVFRYLPYKKLSWSSIGKGAAVSGVLFIVGRIVLGVYLHFTNPGSAYGAAGALLVILLWIYYSSEVLFLGASFAHSVEKLEKIK